MARHPKTSGDRCDTSRVSAAKPKWKKLSQKEQSERFRQTARQLEANESGDKFEKVMTTVVAPVNGKKLVPQKRLIPFTDAKQINSHLDQNVNLVRMGSLRKQQATSRHVVTANQTVAFQ